jgi:hypothetical protein
MEQKFKFKNYFLKQPGTFFKERNWFTWLVAGAYETKVPGCELEVEEFSLHKAFTFTNIINNINLATSPRKLG